MRPRLRPRASAGGFRTAADEAVRSPRPQGRALGEAAAGRGGRRLIRHQRGRGGCQTGRAASGASPCRTPAGSAAPRTAVRGRFGQHLKGSGSPLEAGRTWSCLDDAVVRLGAGIRCADGVPVETVVDHRSPGELGTAALTRGPDGAGGAWSDVNAGARPEAAPAVGRPAGSTTAPTRPTPATPASSCRARPATRSCAAPSAQGGRGSSPTTPPGRPWRPSPSASPPPSGGQAAREGSPSPARQPCPSAARGVPVRSP